MRQRYCNGSDKKCSAWRVLLINQFFYPDSAATSQFLTDLARHLVSGGHVVRVICGRSSYADPDSAPSPLVQIIRPPDLPGVKEANPAGLSSTAQFGSEVTE